MPFCFKRKEDLPDDLDNRMILAVGLSLLDIRGLSYFEIKGGPPIQLEETDIDIVIENIKRDIGRFRFLAQLPRIPTKKEVELLIGTKFQRTP